MKSLLCSEISDEALSVYNNFKNKAGLQHIATSVNIQILIDLCKRVKPARILEMGGGIGTITFLLLNYSQAIVDVYEDNEFCIEQLKNNLFQFEGRYNIIDNYRLLPPEREYDMVIVDGGNGKIHDGGFGKSVWFFIQYLSRLNIIFIEGFRKLQFFYVRDALKYKYHYTIQQYKGEVEKGCCILRCTPCRSRLLRYLNYIYWELRIRREIKKTKNFLYRI